jgi:acyl-CoA thioester hydrolase
MIAHPQDIPPDGRHRYTVRVYYEDTDAGGVVYHANYLRFAERARTEALRVMGIPHAELVERHGMMFMVRRAEVDYVRPARPDDLLVIETETLTVGGASLSLRQTVLGPEGPCAVLRIGLACVRIAKRGTDKRDSGDIKPRDIKPGDIKPGDIKPGDIKPGRIPPRWRAVLGAMRDSGAAGRDSIGVEGSGSNG